MKLLLTSLILIFAINSFSQSKITPQDLKKAIGNWEGSISYLDYQTNKPFTMNANLIVLEGKNEYSLILNNIYPSEPKANNSDKIKISKSGTLINNNLITTKEILENGSIKIQTEKKGKDNRKDALIRYIYIIGSKELRIQKEVKFNENKTWILRNEFNYKRKL